MSWGRRCPRVWPQCATCIPRVFSRLVPTQLRLGPIRAESGQLGLESAEPDDSCRNSKKKKVQNAPFDLYLNPTSAQFTKCQNISSLPLLTFRLSLVFVLSASLPLFLLPYGCETLSHSALPQFTASIHSFFSSLSRILNSGIIIKLSILV